MSRIPFFVLMSLIIAGASFVLATAGQLPDPVATHFGADGRANAWMSAGAYRRFVLAFIALFPLFMLFMVGVLSRWVPRWTNIPNRDYWIAPERRAAAMQILFARGCWLACLVVLMIAGIHYAIVAAHRQSPPLLPMMPFLLPTGGFLLGVIVWIVMLRRRLKRTDAGP